MASRREDLEDRRISAETERFIAEAEQARRQAQLFYEQARHEPLKAYIAGAATVVAAVVAILGTLRALGLV